VNDGLDLRSGVSLQQGRVVQIVPLWTLVARPKHDVTRSDVDDGHLDRVLVRAFMDSRMTAGPPLRVLVVDESGLAVAGRLGWSHAAERFDIVGHALEGARALELAGHHHPDVVLVALGLPDMVSGALLPALRAVTPWSRVVVVPEPGAVEGGAGEAAPSPAPRDERVAAHVAGEAAFSSSTDWHGVDHDGSSVGAARRFADAAVSAWRCDDLRDDVRLVTSELVTNAILHGQPTRALQLRLADDLLCVAVADGGEGSPAPGPPTVTSGRGMLLVSSMCEAWGVDPSRGGKEVWGSLSRREVVSSGSYLVSAG
jgi:anti-sigma regulatory factor (Ser/Thr protein kinase)